MQEALPREMYVDEATWRVERDAVLFGEWFCVGRLDALGLAESRRGSWWSTSPASPCSSPATSRARCTRRTTSAGTGAARSFPPPCRRRSVGVPGLRVALSLPLLDLRARRHACSRRRTRTSTDTAGVRAAPGRRRGLGRLRLRAPVAGAGAAARGVGRAARPTRFANYGLADLVVGCELHLRRGGQLQGPPRELQRVLPLRPGASRAVPTGAVVRRRWRRPRLGGRHPAPRRSLDVHDHRHDDARSAAGAGRRRAHPAQGRPRLPEPDDLGIGRPRRCVRAPAARAEPHDGRVLAALRRRTPSRPPTSTRATPATCGTWSTGRTGRSASRCSAGCRRAATATAGSRRWRTTASTSAAGCCRGSAAGIATERREHAGRLRRRRAGRARLRDRLRAGQPRPQRRGAGAFRARAHQRRQPRHQPDPAAQLPHAGVRAADPGRLRRLGSARARERSPPGHEGRRPRPVPAAGRDPADRLRRLAHRGRASSTRCSTPPTWPRAGRSSTWRAT